MEPKTPVEGEAGPVRALKWLIGLLLLPVCVSATAALGQLVMGTVTAPGDWPLSTRALFAGFLLWIVLYLCLPRPARAYVLAHELTHALWGWMFGAEIKGLKVTKKGGHVKLTKNNFLITLAPYFCPFYTLCVVLLYLVLTFFVDMTGYEPLWLGWIGLTWGFHLTFTLSALALHQPDIRMHGRLFSYSVIYLCNVLGIVLWVVTVSTPSWTEYGALIADHLSTLARHLRALATI